MRKTHKDYWICPDCGSTNVQEKLWVDLNGSSISWESGTEDYFCNDCECRENPVIVTMKVTDSKVVGFQVVSTDGCNDIPDGMEASFCIYSLEQANEIILSDPNPQNWKLLTIFKNNIEEPTFMYSGKNPRVAMSEDLA